MLATPPFPSNSATPKIEVEGMRRQHYATRYDLEYFLVPVADGNSIGRNARASFFSGAVAHDYNTVRHCLYYQHLQYFKKI